MAEAEKSAGSGGNPSEPFDVQKIHHLVRLMKRYDVTALDINDGSARIRLRRRGDQLIAAQPAAPAVYAAVPAAPASPQPAAPQPQAVPAASAPAEPAVKTVVIESPMVGTYYSSSSPDVPPFVSVGSPIQADTVVCIIEAMKVFTDIPAGLSGAIAEILVKNGQAVEYGQPLFRVRPA